MSYRRSIRILLLLAILHHPDAGAQPVMPMIASFPELTTDPSVPISLFSVVINGTGISSDAFEPEADGSFQHRALELRADLSEPVEKRGYRYRTLVFRNLSQDTLELENLVPLGVSDERPYITGHGPPGLARATLFRPGRGPVGLIVPDNAWELGFTTLQLRPDSGIALLARRVSWEHALRRRYSTLVYPGGEVAYRIYTDAYAGDWKSGLTKVFRERWLYDLESFDNRLYERSDLQWIREDYLAVLQFAWDQDFYAPEKGNYEPFRAFFHRYDRLHGGYDIYGIWQGWPRLGLDPRNQWDLFRDLPGGTDSLRALSQYCREQGSAFFIAFNPWDESTRKVDHLEAMSDIIGETETDGVVLDTRGSSSAELQQAADRARPGVVMYSEGMAVPLDMPGIISGRVHNAILMSPPLNMNRLIKPAFQVFRVLDLRDGRLRREMAICLFNGYGAELNLFSPAHPWWVEEEYTYMGRCLMILRQNSQAFHDLNWTPLVNSPDSIWINAWDHGGKKIYSILSLKPGGHSGPLLQVPDEELHWISLWDHEEIIPREVTPQEINTHKGVPASWKGRGDPISMVDYHVDPFTPASSGTRSEGSVQVIAGFPKLLKVEFTGPSLKISAPEGDRVVVWKGDPAYANQDKQEFGPESGVSADRTSDPDPETAINFSIPLTEWMHLPEGKLVVQLFRGEELLDERILHTGLATPVRINDTERTQAHRRAPEGMVEVKGGSFLFYRGNDADFIPYPHNFDTIRAEVGDFYMDRYPVTNSQFHAFLKATGYRPEDPSNFLRHWNGDQFPDSLADHPVVWVSLEDARTYARWKGNRLPTEMEWQYAAQGTDGRAWPWGEPFDSTLCNFTGASPDTPGPGNHTGHTTPVNAHPGGRSPFGVEDLVGNVWQLCDDVYSDGSFTFSMIRGGSFYQPTSSWWYVQGGPQSNHRTQMLLKTSPGFDRSATVGFRCACDQ